MKLEPGAVSCRFCKAPAEGARPPAVAPKGASSSREIRRSGPSCLLGFGAGSFAFVLVFILLLSRGILGRTHPEPADFPGGKGDARCAYRECGAAPEGPATFPVQVDSGSSGNKIVIYTDTKTALLCSDHAACARRSRWPDNPYAWVGFLVAVVASGVAGLAALGGMMFLSMRGKKPRAS